MFGCTFKNNLIFGFFFYLIFLAVLINVCDIFLFEAAASGVKFLPALSASLHEVAALTDPVLSNGVTTALFYCLGNT